MKKCPFCAEEIQDEAIVCKHCGRDLKGGASQVQIVQPKKKTGCVAAGCATLLVLLGIGWLVSLFSGHPNTAPEAVVRTPPAALAAKPQYKIVERMKMTAKEKAEDAASIARQQRRNPMDPNVKNRQPVDLLLTIEIDRVNAARCLAVAREIISSEKFGSQTVRFFFWEPGDRKGIAPYLIEWSRVDGFHGSGRGESYHALNVQ